jgi:hypothetical protein
MPAMSNLTAVIDQLQHERIRLQSQLEALSQAIATLNGSSGGRRTLPASARARIAAAQRARWAKAKGKVVSIVSPKRRKMSATAVAKIRAAQRTRWAKWRKAHKGA